MCADRVSQDHCVRSVRPSAVSSTLCASASPTEIRTPCPGQARTLTPAVAAARAKGSVAEVSGSQTKLAREGRTGSTGTCSFESGEHLPDGVALDGQLPPAAGQRVECRGKPDGDDRCRETLADGLRDDVRHVPSLLGYAIVPWVGRYSLDMPATLNSSRMADGMRMSSISHCSGPDRQPATRCSRRPSIARMYQITLTGQDD